MVAQMVGLRATMLAGPTATRMVELMAVTRVSSMGSLSAE